MNLSRNNPDIKEQHVTILKSRNAGAFCNVVIVVWLDSVANVTSLFNGVSLQVERYPTYFLTTSSNGRSLISIRTFPSLQDNSGNTSFNFVRRKKKGNKQKYVPSSIGNGRLG